MTDLGSSWTSSQVFEQADENPLLYTALARCLGPQPTIQGLSKLLIQLRGRRGQYTLRYVKRGNSGSLFAVQQCSTPAGIHKSRVGKTTGRRSLGIKIERTFWTS
jgi:hypothetical protein